VSFPIDLSQEKCTCERMNTCSLLFRTTASTVNTFTAHGQPGHFFLWRCNPRPLCLSQPCSVAIRCSGHWTCCTMTTSRIGVSVTSYDVTFGDHSEHGRGCWTCCIVDTSRNKPETFFLNGFPLLHCNFGQWTAHRTCCIVFTSLHPCPFFYKPVRNRDRVVTTLVESWPAISYRTGRSGIVHPPLQPRRSITRRKLIKKKPPC